MRLLKQSQKDDYRMAEINALKQHPNCKIKSVYDIIIVTYESQYKQGMLPCLKVWKAKAAHPFVNYAYHNQEQRDKAIDGYVGSAEYRTGQKAKLQREKSQFVHTLKIDDIMHCSWGYDQTNCNFYQVTEVNGKFVTIRDIGSKHVAESDGFMCDKRLPDKDQFIVDSEPIRKKVLEGNRVNISSYSSAHKWDGQECYCSWYA